MMSAFMRSSFRGGFFAATLFAVCSVAHAETSPPSPTSGLFQAMFGLILILALLGGAVWVMRRMGLVKKINTASNVKIVGGVNVGNRERVLVVEVADQWIVVGVAPGRVSALSTMPKQDMHAVPTTAGDAGPQNFSAWLKQTIDKRNVR